MTEPKPTWGGARPNSGRKRREAKKSTPIWCGQLEPAEREFILQWLKPAAIRGEILLAIARRVWLAHHGLQPDAD